MKKLPYIVLLIIFVTVTGCQHERRLWPFGWTATTPEFDSLVIRSERFDLFRDSFEQRAEMSRLMDSIAAAHPDDRVLAQRSMYWRGRKIMNTIGGWDEGLAIIRKALEMTDSSRYPYDYNVMRWALNVEYQEPSIEYYNDLEREYDFFLSEGDLMRAGGSAMELSALMNTLGDTDASMSYLDTADSLYIQAGCPRMVSHNRINRALTLAQAGDSAAANAIYRDMLADTVMPLLPFVAHMALSNLYASDCSDTASLHRAFEIAMNTYGMDRARGINASDMCDVARRNGNLEEARRYMEIAEMYIPTYNEPEIWLSYFNARYLYFYDLGQIDSAYVNLYRFNELYDSINSAANKTNVFNALLAGRIRLMKQQVEIEERNSVILSLSVSFGVVMILIVVCICFWRKLQRQRLAEMRQQLELERTNRRLLANEVVIKEKDRLLDDVEEEMTRLSETGEISRSAAVKFGSTIRSHNSMKQHRESFVEVFGEVNPSFGDRLRSDFPSLTPSDIRIASYIVTGMESKHIAGVMGIRPESVKQARWRLRTKLSLASTDSLEQFLRHYATPQVPRQ